MTGETRQKQDGDNPLRHNCYMTRGRVGFISFLDLSDFVAIGLAFYLGGQIANSMIPDPTGSILFIMLCTVAAWFINFGIKRKLNPYPRFVEFFFNWWFNGIDYYVPDVDSETVPLIVTREMSIGHSMKQIEKQTGQELVTRQRRKRRTRVRKTQQKE